MKILYVIVLYKCKLEDSKSYQSLLQDRNEPIFVYDNSSISQEVHGKNVIYVHDPQNRGLGVAYNTAAQYARYAHFDWLLLLDQDTTFPFGAIDVYIKSIINYPAIKMFVPIHQISDGRYISPTRYICKGSHPSSIIKSGILDFKEAAPINSGIMINVDAFYKVGCYDEEVMLDFSDIRFMEKFRKIYPKFYAIGEIVCLQDFSIEEQNLSKLMMRCKIFLHCALACKREHLLDYFSYFFVTIKRTVHLLWQTHSFSFLSVYVTNYLLGKSEIGNLHGNKKK